VPSSEMGTKTEQTIHGTSLLLQETKTEGQKPLDLHRQNVLSVCAVPLSFLYNSNPWTGELPWPATSFLSHTLHPRRKLIHKQKIQWKQAESLGGSRKPHQKHNHKTSFLASFPGGHTRQTTLTLCVPTHTQH